MSAPVIAVYSTKGGVGKTTTAVNLAWEAAADGNRVLLWDLDPQSAATWLLGVKPRVKGGATALIRGKQPAHRAIRETSVDGIDVLPADDSYRDLDITIDAEKKSSSRIAQVLKPLAKEYDVIVLDCPPGASRLAENALRAAGTVVLPLSPSSLALRSLDQVRTLVADSKGRTTLVGFLNQVDRRKRAHREAAAELPAAEPDITDISVPASVHVERMGERRAPIGAFAARTDPGRAFSALWYRVSRAG